MSSTFPVIEAVGSEGGPSSPKVDTYVNTYERVSVVDDTPPDGVTLIVVVGAGTPSSRSAVFGVVVSRSSDVYRGATSGVSPHQ